MSTKTHRKCVPRTKVSNNIDIQYQDWKLLPWPEFSTVPRPKIGTKNENQYQDWHWVPKTKNTTQTEYEYQDRKQYHDRTEY